MVRLRFTPTAEKPTFLFKKGGPVQVPHGDGFTTKIAPHVICNKPGQIVETDDPFIAAWCIDNYGDNFALADSTAEPSDDAPALPTPVTVPPVVVRPGTIGTIVSPPRDPVV